MGDKEQNVQSAPVWVVDDDHAIRWVLSRALSKAGIECRLFEEAESVLKALEDSAPMVLGERHPHAGSVGGGSAGSCQGQNA